MDVSIGEVRLAVRASQSAAAASRDACERFARRVLEVVGEQWEARWPGRVIFVRELAVNWRLSANAFENDDAIAQAATDVTSTVEDLINRADVRPHSHASVVAFSDRAAYLLAYWEAVIDGTASGCWWLEDAAEHGTNEAVAVIESALVGAWRSDRLADILIGLPTQWQERIAAVTQARAALMSGALEREQRLLPAGEEAQSLALRLRRPPPSLDSEATSIWFAVAAFATLPNRPPAEQLQLARVALEQWSRALPSATTDDALGERHGADADSRGEITFTEYGGVAFLLSLIIELDLGSALWEACLPEGALIGAALSNLIGGESEHDPLIRAIAGDWDGEPGVETAQQEEVAIALLREFLRASVRRGAAIPAVRLRLWHRAHERFLVACAADEFPCFVWPADSASALARGLALFLHEWPCHSVRPEAAPGLATVDHAGRIRASFDNSAGPAPFLPAEVTAPFAALTTQIGGTLGALWSTRLQLERPLDRDALVNRYLRLPGRVRIADERVDVILPMDHTDLDVRRAGLDRDPGWVPWLRKNLRVEFADKPGGG